MNFSSLNLTDPLLRAITDQGYTIPTPIQAKAIPIILKGQDLLASAQTGTGKTASFVLPLLQNLAAEHRAMSNHAKVLILAPTRELAAQIQQDIIHYGKYLQIRSTVVYGGVKINPQMMKLRAGVEILVATPGRLLDLYNQNAIHFDHLKALVLDEADRMLDMGFIHDIKRIMTLLPKKRQTLLFSATFSNAIKQLAQAFLKNPVEITIAPHQMTAVSVKHILHPVDKSRKADLLSHLIEHHRWDKALVFTKTKHGANKVTKILNTTGIEAAAIHGNKSQSQRTKALADFKAGKIQILVATDIAARGIDIDQLPVVINFDLPHVPEDYVHRIGRTGRAGAQGHAISLLSADEIKPLQAIEGLLKQKIKRIEVETFEPDHQIPNAEAMKPHAKPFKSAKAKRDSRPHQKAHSVHKSHQSNRNKRTQRSL